MWVRVAAALLCACAVIETVHTAAITTPDTFVVSKADESTTPASDSALGTATEGPMPPVKLSEMAVDSEVSLRYARTAVVSRVRNPASRAQETTFRVLLPETAFISGFVMTLDGKSYKAYVKEKEEAKQIYNQAVSQGIGAAHIATKARDSNHFTVSVNVEPKSEAVFNLTYEELLTRRAGVYNHAINLHPGALVPRLTVRVHIKETNNITTLRVPEVRTGNEIDADETDPLNKKAVIEKSGDGKEATITFTPDLDEQRQLMQVYAEKSKESRNRVSSPWYQNQTPEDQQEGVLGQFVVQYDVERPKAGEIMVNDGYFVHFFAPSSLPPLNKHVVFVLDTSGSMMERKIEQLRDAMTSILDDLNRGDYFSIVEFSSDVTVHDLKEADEEEKKVDRYTFSFDYNEKPVTLVPPSEVTDDNIRKAKVIVKRMRADGGTNIARALEIATQLISKGITWTLAPANTTSEDTITPLPLSDQKTTVTTSGEPMTQTKDKNKAGDSQRLVPIIIFLTDGEPTVGTTDPKKIISTLSEQNYGSNKAAIYSLAFGEDADRSFLRKLSLRNDGFMRHIYEAADAALQLRHFYREVSSPLLADVKFTYPPDQVKEDSLTKRKFRTFYAESETIVAGRIADEAVELNPEITGFCGVDDGIGRKKYRISPKIPVARNSSTFFPLERLWAYLTIQQLLDDRDAADDDTTADNKNATDDKTPAKKALDIALKYEFVTPLTSLVVVKPNASNTVDAESVDKLPGDYFATSNGFLPGGPLTAYQTLSSRRGGGILTRRYHHAPANRISGAFDTRLEYGSLDVLDSGSEGVSNLMNPAAFAASPVLYDAMMENAEIEDYDNAGYVNSAAVGGLVGPLSLSPMSSFSKYYSAVQGPPPGFLAPLSTTPVLAEDLITNEATASGSGDVTSVLKTYDMDNFTWLEPIIDQTTDQITVQNKSNGTTVTLKLARQGAPVDIDLTETCTKSVIGSPGKCVYLRRCSAAQNITLADYERIYCSTKQGFAGVCCPEDAISTV